MADFTLPYKWRAKVKQRLDNKGVKLSLQQITDIKRGKSADLTLTKIVMSELGQVQREHRRKMAAIQRMTKKK